MRRGRTPLATGLPLKHTLCPVTTPPCPLLQGVCRAHMIPQWDWFDDHEIKDGTGNRMATVLMYLSGEVADARTSHLCLALSGLLSDSLLR